MQVGYKYLENRTSRYAFWEGWLEQRSVGWDFVFRFGKIGSNTRPRRKRFSSKWGAEAALNDKVLEKLMGDYVDQTKPAQESVRPVAQAQPVVPVEPAPVVDGFDFFDALMVG